MTSKNLGVFAFAVMLLLATGQPAHAALVTFSTSGIFGSTGTATLAKGGITISFSGFSDTVDATDPGAATSFGSFVVTGENPPSTGGLEAETFLLTITQTAPPGSAGFPATMAGQINFNNSSAILTFTSPLTREILGYFYTITNEDGELVLPAPDDSPNSVGIGGHIIGSDESTGTTVPEPAELLLFGVAALVVGRGLRRRLTR